MVEIILLDEFSYANNPLLLGTQIIRLSPSMIDRSEQVFLLLSRSHEDPLCARTSVGRYTKRICTVHQLLNALSHRISALSRRRRLSQVSNAINRDRTMSLYL